MERLYEGEIKAIIPHYEDNIGNVTKVYIKGKDPFIVKKRLTYVLKELCKYYYINLEHLKDTCFREFGCKKLIPIPFGDGNTFIPFKIRKPSISNDGAFGYINFKYIENITYHKKEKKLEVNLNGQKIDCISKLDSVQKHMTMGKIISKTYIPLKMNEKRECENLFIIEK